VLDRVPYRDTIQDSAADAWRRLGQTRRGTIYQVIGTPPAAEHLRDLARLRRGIRDCAFRDPAGNLIRIQELR
jgi:hypothetical protein